MEIAEDVEIGSSHESHTPSTTSARKFVKAKRFIALVGFVAIIALQILDAIWISHLDQRRSSTPGEIDTARFTCGEDIVLGSSGGSSSSSIHFNVCNSVISLSSNTSGGVNLTEVEWSELDKLLRR